MILDKELTLITSTDEVEEDDVGNQVPIQEELIVFCDEKSVSRSEFYSAARSGLNKVSIFVIHKFEYNKQEAVKFEDERYEVIKTYDIDNEYIELTCKRVKQ